MGEAAKEPLPPPPAPEVEKEKDAELDKVAEKTRAASPAA